MCRRRIIHRGTQNAGIQYGNMSYSLFNQYYPENSLYSITFGGVCGLMTLSKLNAPGWRTTSAFVDRCGDHAKSIHHTTNALQQFVDASAPQTPTCSTNICIMIPQSQRWSNEVFNAASIQSDTRFRTWSEPPSEQPQCEVWRCVNYQWNILFEFSQWRN